MSGQSSVYPPHTYPAISLVPEGGLEPPLPKGLRILSPLCLPISPLGRLPYPTSTARCKASGTSPDYA